MIVHPKQELLLIGTKGGKVLCCDPTQGTVVHRIDAHSADVTRIVVDSAADRILSSAVDGTIRAWGEGFRRVGEWAADSPVYGLACSSSGREIATGSADKILRIWDAESGELLQSLDGHPDAITDCRWVTKEVLVTAGAEGYMLDWQVEAKRCFRQSRGHQQRISQLLSSHGGDWYVSAGWDGAIQAWNLQHRVKFSLPEQSDPILAIALTNDDRLLVAAHWDGTVRIWDLETGRLHDEFTAHESSLLACALASGSGELITADQNGVLRSWDLSDIGVTRYVNQHYGEVYSLDYTADNGNVLSVAHDGQLKVWDRDDRSEIGFVDAQVGPIMSCATSPDNLFWAIGSADGQIKVWSVENQCFEITLRGHHEGISALRFVPGGERLISASWDLKVKLWSLQAHAAECVFDGHSKEVAACDVSRDARKMASCGWDCSVRVWDLTGRMSVSRTESLLHEGHRERVLCCAISPDGASVASGSADQTVRIWSTSKLGEPQLLLGHAAPVSACRFTADGRLLLTADQQGVLMIWNAEDGQNLGGLQHDEAVLSLAVAPDGTQAVIGDAQGRVRFLRLEYSVGATWVAPETRLTKPPIWKRGSPPIEVYDVDCIHCGGRETVKRKQLNAVWKCPRCGAALNLCPRGLPPKD